MSNITKYVVYLIFALQFLFSLCSCYGNKCEEERTKQSKYMKLEEAEAEERDIVHRKEVEKYKMHWKRNLEMRLIRDVILNKDDDIIVIGSSGQIEIIDRNGAFIELDINLDGVINAVKYDDNKLVVGSVSGVYLLGNKYSILKRLNNPDGYIPGYVKNNKKKHILPMNSFCAISNSRLYISNNNATKTVIASDFKNDSINIYGFAEGEIICAPLVIDSEMYLLNVTYMNNRAIYVLNIDFECNAKDIIYVGDYNVMPPFAITSMSNNILVFCEREVRAFNEQHEFTWHYNIDYDYKYAYRNDDTMIIVDMEGNVICLNSEGMVLSKFSINSMGEIVGIAEDEMMNLYVLYTDSLYIYNNKYEEVWSMDVGDIYSLSIGPIIGENAVYCADVNSVYCIKEVK